MCKNDKIQQASEISSSVERSDGVREAKGPIPLSPTIGLNLKLYIILTFGFSLAIVDVWQRIGLYVSSAVKTF